MEVFEGMSALIDQTIQQVRQLSTGLRPTVLDDLDLVAAIKWQAGEFSKRTSIRCLVRSSLPAHPPDPVISTALFRIFQEGLTNIIRHAKATKVVVALHVRGGKIRFTVADNGIGISTDQANNRKSLGLLGMAERALSIGGSLNLRGKPGRGTTLTVESPLRVPKG